MAPLSHFQKREALERLAASVAQDFNIIQTLIKEIESRLGTDREQPRDIEHVRALAHRLNNILTDVSLQDGLSKMQKAG
jgi:hypothetical protein